MLRKEGKRLYWQGGTSINEVNREPDKLEKRIAMVREIQERFIRLHLMPYVNLERR